MLSFSIVSERVHGRQFIDSDKAVSIQAPSPYSNRYFYGKQTQFTIRILSLSHCLYHILNRILSG